MAKAEEEEDQIGTMKKLTMVTKQTSNAITKGSNAIFASNMATLKKVVEKRQNNKQILLKKMSKKVIRFLPFLILKSRKNIWFLDSGCNNHMHG